MTERQMQTKRVRAWNVKPGDELSWFDSKAKAEIAMLVKTVRVCAFADGSEYVSLEVVKRDAKRKQRYVWRTAKNASVRVRRAVR